MSNGCFHPEAIKAREPSGEQPGELQVCDHAASLHQAEPTLEHAVALRAVHSRVLMADGVSVAQPREYLVHELDAVVRPDDLTSSLTSDRNAPVASSPSTALVLLRG